MNKKLKFYSFFLAVVYVIFFICSVYETSRYAIAGFEFGYNKGKERDFDFQVCGGFLTPVDGSVIFPTTILNEKTGKDVHIEIRQVFAYMDDTPEQIPAYVTILSITAQILTFVLLVLFIYLPFVVYKIMKSITKNEFYSIQNIKRIRKVSFILLTIFAIIFYSSVSIAVLTNAYLQIKNYTACIGEFNFPLLFIGLVVLILSEILKYTTTIKEEQDLTI
ncbi:MAG: DUF2975 domain-containing protein [Prevotellaceae bacterium]|jgi:hypothetical protein|nr:DUF2975 domain-containing protein [Prevotellaceae bacterium]